MKILRSLLATMMITILLAGCSGTDSEAVKRFDPKAVTSEITMEPAQPVVGEVVKFTIKASSEEFESVLPIRDGMRVELRDNSRSNRIYDATDITTEDTSLYEVEVTFESEGENTVYLHYNVNTVHIMQKKTIEVNPS